MVKSRHNTLGCWFFLSVTAFFFFFLLLELLSHFSIIHISFVHKLDNRAFYFAMLAFGLPFIFNLWLSSIFIKRVTIDEGERSISFLNLVTRQCKIYQFSDFDGFIETELNHLAAGYLTIGFMKNKKVARYVDSCWVSNIDEIKNSLSEMPHLGVMEKGSFKQLRFILRMKIID